MKHTYSLLALSALLALVTSCTRDEDETNAGGKEIHLSTAIAGVLSKTIDSGLSSWFQMNDKIGFTLLTTNGQGEATTYHRNVPFVCSRSGSETGYASFNTEGKAILWPESTNPCTLLAYYPYEKESPIKEGKATWRVQTDQQAANKYSQSDFLTARIDNQQPQIAPVHLSFAHRLSRINFILRNGLETDNPEALLPASVVVNGMYTTGTLDLATSVFSDRKTVSNILPNGSFKESVYQSKPCLVGPKVLVIPQTVPPGTVLFTLNINGEEYTYQAETGPADVPPYNVFEGGTSYNFIFTLRQGATPSDKKIEVTCSIQKWEEAPDIEVGFSPRINR